MDKLLILDLGGAQSYMLAHRVRGENVYCEIVPYDTPAREIAARGPKGLIIVGGTQDSENDCSQEVYDLGLPILCFGGGARSAVRHFGGILGGTVIEDTPAHIDFSPSPVFEELTECDRFIDRCVEWSLPEGFTSVAVTKGDISCGFACEDKKLYGMQFYPEQHDPDGLKILSNFACGICGCEREWNIEAFIDQKVSEIREKVGERTAMMAISGGVDSTVCAALVNKALGHGLHCLFIDTGLMRKNEAGMIRMIFGEQQGIKLSMVEAQDRFLAALNGISDPEEKRAAINREFEKIYEEEAERLGQVDFLVEGTIYSDLIEGSKEPVNTHTDAEGRIGNVHHLEVLEPLRELFKSDVREAGLLLGIPEDMVYRQPFPGPGLAIRCKGEVTAEKLAILREADAIFREEVEIAGMGRKIGQYFAMLIDMDATGIRDGERVTGSTIALRAVNSTEAMKATAARLPYDLLEKCVTRITQEVPGVLRVMYDVTGKPPATIEWE